LTFDEYNIKLNNVIQAMSSDANGALMVEVASDALALIRKRVIDSGVDAEGAKYEPYSTRPFFVPKADMSLDAYNKLAGSKTKRRELKWATFDGVRMVQIPGGYKEFRELHGRQTGFVDFSFSGRMWANIKITSNFLEHAQGVARISATQQENKDKLAENTKRRGDILNLSKTEIKDLSEIYNMGIVQIFTKNGL
jgi:hypothetical protein